MPRVKLTDEDVKAIRASDEPLEVLARHYPVHIEYLRQVKMGRDRNPVDPRTGRRKVPVQRNWSWKARTGDDVSLTARCPDCNCLFLYDTDGTGHVWELCGCGALPIREKAG